MTARLFEVTLEGDALARGRAHGEELRVQIRGARERWRDELASAVGSDVDGYLRDFLAVTDFPSAIDAHTPGMLDEVRGIAQGAGLEFEECLAYQLADEEWWFRDRRTQQPRAAEQCSTAGAVGTSGAPTVVGQNMDMESFRDGTQTLLRIESSAGEPDALVFTAAGLVALDGCNRSGLGVCVNTLRELTPDARGLPVAFAIRGLLRCRELAEADAYLRRVPHASGQNYLVGTPEGIVDLECSAGGASEYRPTPTRAVHTNHALASADLVSDLDLPAGALPGSTTHARFELLARELLGHDGALDVRKLRAVFGDRTVPLSRAPSREGGFMTFGSVVMELGKEPVLHLAPGPPAHTPFTAHAFD